MKITPTFDPHSTPLSIAMVGFGVAGRTGPYASNATVDCDGTQTIPG